MTWKGVVVFACDLLSFISGALAVSVAGVLWGSAGVIIVGTLWVVGLITVGILAANVTNHRKGGGGCSR